MAEQSTSGARAEMRDVWPVIASTFSYQHATISSEDLLSRHQELQLSQEEITNAIEWGKSEQLLEVADENGRLRLTPVGRRSWRSVTGQA
jgi:hypothetical protein